MKHWLYVPLACMVCLVLAGCPNPGVPGDSTGDDQTPDTSGDTTTDAALNFAGSVSGEVATSSSSAGASEGGRKLAPFAISSNATGWFTDVEGNPLTNDAGEEYPPFPIATDGTFEATGLPVGVEVVANLDLDGDGTADLFTMFNIPKDEDGDTGTLDGVVADPLSTVTYARVKKMLEEQGVENAGELAVSVSALVQQIRDAFEALELLGMEFNIDLADITGLDADSLADWFDSNMPEGAQRGMRMAASNVALTNASDVNGLALRIAETLVQGGFTVIDEPGSDLDLSTLASLPNVEEMTMQEFDSFMTEGFADSTQAAPGPPDMYETNWNPTIYVSLVSEPDRNFSESEGEAGFMMKPMVGEELLLNLADAYLNGKRISLGNFYRLLVDAERGLGLRLTYDAWWETMWDEPTTGGNGEEFPEIATIFEGSNGQSVSKNLNDLFQKLEEAGAFNPENWDANRARIRNAVAAFLQGTTEPSFERLFGPLIMRRIPSAEQVARHIRSRKAHLPFSISGPSRIYVVAEEDEWENPDTDPVTVNLEFDRSGQVVGATYVANGSGKYLLQLGWIDEGVMEVGPILAKNGKPLFDEFGWPVWLDMTDQSVFNAIAGTPFHDAFSTTRTDYPVAPAVRVANEDFDPTQPADPETNPRNWEIWALMTSFDPDAEAVRVSYENQTATYNAGGQYYVAMGPDTWDTGEFELMSSAGHTLLTDPTDPESVVTITPDEIAGLTVPQEEFSFVYGTGVPNPAYDADGAPYYDDMDNDGTEDSGEPRFDNREFLWDVADWRSTNVEVYYRTQSGGWVDPAQVDWESDTPKLLDGTTLVPRTLRPRLNAWRYGRPNTAINLFMAFSPPGFFNGTQAFNEDTKLNVLQAFALVDLVLGSVQNVEANVDWDGAGPMPARNQLVDAWFFVPPLDDPIQLIVDTFMEYLE